ncbi:MAG: phosphopantetheine-binding protein [Pirellula sp.]|nr:phosphopantetheine-binding protein [Pirellula sp.]
MSNNEPPKPSPQLNLREVLDDGIVHFDATGARREAMRKTAANRIEKPSNGTTKNGSAHVAVPSSEHRNGNGQLHTASAHASPQSVPTSRISPEPATPTAGPKNLTGVASWKERVQSAIGISSQPVDRPTPPSQPTTNHSASIAPSNNGTQISRDRIRQFLVDFVMEQTGYPEDIVSVDADLEADLGIDSIKIAQMIGEVIEHFGLDAKALQRTSADNYKTLNTIIDTIASLSETGASDSLTTSTTAIPRTPSPAIPPKETIAAAPVASHVADEPCVPELAGSDERRQVMTKFLIDFVIEQTGYPEDIVSVDSDLEADLGIDSIKIAQMVGELNDYFHLNVAALRTKTAADFKTISTIVEAVLSVESPQNTPSPKSTQPKQNASPAIPKTSSPTPMSAPMPAQVSAAPVTSTSSTTTIASPTSSSSKSLNAHELQSFLTAFVVEQTGYPEDIVTLDADLEADLGIDSIKIAQMMGEMNDHFGLTIKDYDGRTMDDFKSLGAIISHLTK